MFNFAWKKRDISKELNEINNLIIQIKLTDALEKINHLLSLKKLRIEDRLALLVIKVDVLNLMGRHLEIIDLAENVELTSFDKLIRSNDPNLVKWLLNVGIAHLNVGNHERAKQFISQARSFLKTINDPSITSLTEVMDARLKISEGQLNLALETLSELTDIEKHAPFFDDSIKTTILIEMGTSHVLKGEIHHALFILSQITLSESKDPKTIQNRVFRAISLSEAYFMQLEHLKSRELLQEALKLSQLLKNKYLEARTLLTMVMQLVELNEAREAEERSTQLRKIAEFTKHPKIEKWALITRGLVLKLSKRALKLAESQEIFFKVQDDVLLNQHERIIVKTHLADLLLIELQSFGNIEIFSELTDLLQQIQDNEITKHSFAWQVELKLLQSKIQLLEAKYKEAKRTLSIALHVAHVAGLKKLAVEVSTQMDVLDDEMETWQKSADAQKHLTIEERIAQSQLKNIVLKMIKRRIEDIPHLKPEKPETFLIMEESGQIIFSHNFNPERRLNEQLIGGFLAAINSFGKETFSASGSIERIKHQEHTLLLNAEENLYFCYIFQGQSYSALEKLSSFIKKTKKNPEMWNSLITWNPTNPLPQQIEEQIKKLVQALFSTESS